jgi:hypothetical protein
MPHPRFSSEQIEEGGESIYAERLRSGVETEENIGKISSIDIETQDYKLSEVGDLLTRAMRLQAKHPSAFEVKEQSMPAQCVEYSVPQQLRAHGQKSKLHLRSSTLLRIQRST